MVLRNLVVKRPKLPLDGEERNFSGLLRYSCLNIDIARTLHNEGRKQIPTRLDVYTTPTIIIEMPRYTIVCRMICGGQYLGDFDVGDAGDALAAFVRVVEQGATGAGHPAADHDAGLLLAPFGPADPRAVDRDHGGSAQRRQVLGAGIVAHEHRREGQQRVEVVEREPLIDHEQAVGTAQVGRQCRHEISSLRQQDDLAGMAVQPGAGKVGETGPAAEGDPCARIEDDEAVIGGEPQRRQPCAEDPRRGITCAPVANSVPNRSTSARTRPD